MTKLAKDDAYETSLRVQEAKVLSFTICAGADVPDPAPLEFESYLPFLALPD